MLEVYTYCISRPARAIDLSLTPLEELSTAVLDIYDHQREGTLWFGYLDGWMLTPREEVLMRKALRKFDCILFTAVPLALPFAWQNEIRTIYTRDPHGDSHINNDGSLVHDGREIEHRHSGSGTSFERIDHQGGKTGCPPQG